MTRTPRLLALLLLVGGCVRAGFEASSAREASADQAGADQAGTEPDSGACVPAWRCGGWAVEDPTLVTSLRSSSAEYEPYLTPDCLQIYFASGRADATAKGHEDVWSATRPDTAQPFSDVANVGWLNSQYTDEKVAFSGDGTQVFLSTDRPGGPGHSDIWWATRSSPGASFGALAPVAVVNTTAPEYDPWLSADGLRLYFVTTEAGKTDQDIVMATRASPSSQFGAPVVVPKINSSENDDNPALSSDELLIIFGSNRPGSQGDDLWYAVRTDRDVPFSTPERVPGANSAGYDSEPFIACQDTALWMASDRDQPGQPPSLYRSRFVAP